MDRHVLRLAAAVLFLSLCISGIVASIAPFVSATTPPDAPANLSVNSGNQTITLYWASYTSTFTGGATVDSIAIHYGTAPGVRTNVTTVSGTATSYIFNNLTLGQKYYFAVRAHNSVGWSPESKEVNTTFSGFPYAPRNLTISYNSAATSMATATVTWEAPLSTGGAPLTHYIFSVSHKISYQYYPYYTWTYDVYATVGPEVTSYVVDSLVRGGSYSVRVEAYNAVGYSYTYVLTVPPATTPGAPTNLRAVPSYDQVSVYWDASSGGGTSVLGYYVKYGTSPTDLPTNVSAGTNQYSQISGLTVGVDYYFSVQSYNSLGWSPESPVISATPIARTVPSAPTSVQVTGTSTGHVYINWYAPVSNGGYGIDEYAIRYSTEPGGVGTTISVGMPVPFEGEYGYILSGLTPGQTYYFTVLAHNSLGWSAVSPEESILYSRAPSAPQGLLITYSGDNPSYTTATMSWGTPPSDGGRPISNYTVDVGKWTYDQYGSHYTSLFHGVYGPGVTSCLADLPRGLLNYTFSVEATNEAGYSNETAILITTPYSAPAPPGYILYPGYNEATLRMYPPTWPATGGTSVDSYMIIYGMAPGDRTYNVTIDANPSSYNDYVFTLTENDTIYCVVRAHNLIGWSEDSAEIVVTSLRTTPVEPTPPTSVSAIRGDGIVAVVWYPPADYGGRAVDTYSILYGTSPGAPSVNLSVGLPYAYSGSSYFLYQITGLTNGQTYYFTVLAHNEVGWSSGSTEVDGVPAAKPTAPQNVNISYSGSNALYGSATIAWDRPSSDGGSTITGYFLDIGYSYQPGYNQPYRWYSMYHISLGPGVTSATVIDLLPRGSAYPIVAIVYANNSVGSTSVSTPIVVPAVAPAAPTSVTASPSYENITLTWPRPSNGGAGIDYYNILYGTSPDDLVYLVNVTATLDYSMSYKINGLSIGTTYYFVVKAHNIAGWSPESPVASSIFATAPSEPMYLDVGYIESDTPLTSAIVYWEEPSFDGGAPLVRYRATVGFPTSTGYHYEYNGVLDAGTLSFVVHNLSRGCNYEVRIVADGLVASSIAEISYAPPVLVPGAPNSLQVVAEGEDNIVLRWGYASENGAPIDQYQVRYGNATGSWTVEVTGGQPYTDVPITGLDSGRAYYFVVLAHNSAGWSAPSNEVGAVLVSPADNTPPELISSTPTDGSTGVSTSASIILRFSEAMDKTSVEGALRVLLGTDALTGTFAWSEGDTVCTFTPSSLSVSATYTVLMNVGATDVPGYGLDPFTFQFTTEMDTVSPVTTMTLDGTLDAYGYYINGVTISLSAVDAQSSVDSIEYSLDGTTWLSYTGPFQLTTKGQYDVYYRSTDVWGNIEPSRSTLVSVAGITIASPTGSSVWTVSTTSSSGANVQYLTRGTVGTSFQFDLYKGGTFIKTIGGNDSLLVIYTSWTQGLVSGDDYQIMVRSTDHTAFWAMSEEFTIVVLPPQSPAALFDVPSITNYKTVSFNASASYSKDSPPGTIQVRWDWDSDGVWDTGYSSELVALHTFSGSGSYTVVLQVLDSNGLTNVTSHSVNVDVTLPSLIITPSGTMGTNGWFISSVGVTLDAADNLGIASVMYRIDNGTWTEYADALSISSQGSHTVYGKATDLAGNQYYARLDLKIDTVAPTIEGAPTTLTNNNGWYNHNVTVHFLASDGGSGIAWATADELVNVEGYDIWITGTAMDQAGNSATFIIKGINIDKTAPVISIEHRSPNGFGWYNAAVTVNFSASDTLSSPAVGTHSHTFSGEGAGQSYIWSVADLAGNVAQYTVSGINIDLTAPTGVAHATTSPNGNGWYNTDVEMVFSFSDTLSGVLSSSGSTAVIGTEGPSATASVIVTDLAGNTASIISPAVKLDKTAPTGSAAPSTAPNSNGWYRSDITMVFALSDSLSGISGSSMVTAQVTAEGNSSNVFVVATDLAGNTATIYSPTVKLDKTAPSGSWMASSSPNSNGWYRSDVTMDFLPGQDLSGIDTDLSDPLSQTIRSEGAGQTAIMTIFDLAGNSASATSPEVNLDKTAPSGSAEPTTGPNANGWYRSDVTIQFSVSDALSGVEGSTALTAVISTEGTGRTASIVVVDQAGNSRTIISEAVNIDKTAPSGSAAPTALPNINGWYNADVTMLFSLSDALSGIDGTEMTQMIIAEEGASITVTVVATDLAGNTAVVASPAVNIDKTAPIINGAPLYAPNVNGWYNDNVTIRFEATDELSGLLALAWNIVMSDEGADQEVTESVSDLAGNVASYTVRGINIDKTSPTIVGEPTIAADAHGWYSGDVIVHFTATDALSGVVAAPEDVVVTGEGSSLVARASVLDLAGNSASLDVTIKIDRTAPATTLFIGGIPSDATGAITVNDTLSFTIDAMDSLSGVNEIRFKVDGGEWNTYSEPFVLTKGEHTLTYCSIDQAGNLEPEQQVTVKVIAIRSENSSLSSGAGMAVIGVIVVAAGGAAGVFLLRGKKP
ncbi:MAG: fibronectin type III domain-containing protein [Methanomassiliicoccales archaeon]|nr:fibronectin type III domain-containing protein [Methanomassiliicoccales archaeon]